MTLSQRVLLEIEWVDENVAGTVTAENGLGEPHVFDGWLELAAALRALTVTREDVPDC